MPKHHSEDYKISAVQYYLDNKTTYSNVCKIFKCSERSLKRWIERYKKDKSIKRYDRKSISYKITKEQGVIDILGNEMKYFSKNNF